MRLTLIERQEPRLRCVPDLGIAQLLGQCRENGIAAKLVQGSPETLECLVDDSVFPLFLKRYKRVADERGEGFLREFLEYNYNIATSNNIYDKTDPDALNELWGLLSFMKEEVWPRWLPGFLYERISGTKPDVVGFSLWDFYDNPKISSAIAEVIRRLRKGLGVQVLAGGPGTVAKSARRDITSIFHPDFIVHHEGELALLEVLEMIESQKLKKTANVTFGKYEGDTKPIEDLDSLPLPDFSQYRLDDFFLPVRVLPVMTSRGCPWAKCAFCNHHATYTGYREHSAKRVAEMIESCREEYDTEMIMFHDETFTSERARGLIGSLPEAYYYSYAYPKGFDRQLLDRMHKKGFQVLVWGIESGCQRVLQLMRKGTDIKEVERIMRDSYSAGITNVAFIMFGFPGETEAEALETVEFLKRNSQFIERHATTAFRLEEDSPIWKKPSAWGVKNKGGGKYYAERGMQQDKVNEFMKKLCSSNVKTSADTKYYMPGDSEMRAYFFMQAAYGEGSGEYPVRNGILRGNEIVPSLLMEGATRPIVKLSQKAAALYAKCDGKHKANAGEFEGYPYVVRYSRKF